MATTTRFASTTATHKNAERLRQKINKSAKAAAGNKTRSGERNETKRTHVGLRGLQQASICANEQQNRKCQKQSQGQQL